MSSLGLHSFLWPIPVILSRLVDYLLGLSILLAFVGFYVQIEITLFWIVPAIAAQFTLTLGLLYILSPVVTLVPDFARLVSVCLRIGFFLTPILYLSVNVPSYLNSWLILNPLTPIFEMHRHAIFGSLVSFETFAWLSFAICILLGAGLLLNQSLRRITLKASIS
jgi:ABC-2 type transport system permease protein